MIWNKGIAALCDHRIPNEFPDGWNYQPVQTLAGALSASRLPESLISANVELVDVREGNLLWVRLSWLRSFVKQVLPFLMHDFILVTGDSDSCVPSEVKSEAHAILASPHVARWYTQNHDGTMPGQRISPIPIGIDFHMLSERPIWGESISPPVQQERELLSIRETLPALKDRIPKIYVDFAWQQSFGFRHYRRFHPLQGTTFHDSRRRVARKMLKNQWAFCQTGPMSRSEMWRARGQYAFVLSPHGMGLDCHRTWEALALGHIVLVPSCSLDPLFVDLPVVPLRAWSEITPENLARWFQRYANKTGVDQKLTTRYWVERMKASFRRHSNTDSVTPTRNITEHSWNTNC